MKAPRILVADDDTWILTMITAVLKKSGYVVETACDGEDAYEKALATIPDLLITDVMMPRMDGWTLVKTLRSRSEFSLVPVIFLTALTSDDDRIRGFRLGADDYMPKPFRFEELDLRVARTLRNRAGLPEVGHGLKGSLEQLGLSSLLTLFDLERKSGVLVATDGATGAVGRIFLSRGRVASARIDDQSVPVNPEAIYLMLTWSTGHFAFDESAIDVPDEIERSTTELLLEGARRVDELAC